MRRSMARLLAAAAGVVLSLTLAVSPPARAENAPLTMDDAVSVALQRNRDVIAARLEIEASQLDVVAARIYPNPLFQVGLGNMVLGQANPQGTTPPTRSGLLGQPVTTVGVSELLDVWAKRSARIRAADRGVDHRRLLVEDAVRDIVFAVRSAFAEVLREQAERQLAHDFADRYAQTVKVSQARFKAGDISEADLRKIELEGQKYLNDVIDADSQLDVARTRLAALLALPSSRDLPAQTAGDTGAPRPVYDLDALVSRALQQRPDLRAAGAARTLAQAEIDAAKREVLPDLVLGAAYTHSDFTVSGDNPNTMALTLSFPLPLFDRNQANIGRAQLDLRRAENDGERLRIAVVRDVAEAVRKVARSNTLLAVFEKPPRGDDVPGTPTGTSDKGGMLERSEIALRVAEKSYRAGAISLIELLEAQRTYLDTRGRYLRALYDFRQATVDVRHAVGDQ